MNVTRWIVLSHCIYRVSNCCLFNLTLVGYDRVPEKRFGILEGPGKVLEFFVSKRVGTLLTSFCIQQRSIDNTELELLEEV